MDILFHYCSVTTFNSIVENRSIHLSSLSLSNDSLEGKLAVNTLKRLAQRDGLDGTMRERLETYLEGYEAIIDGLGFCLSEEGDLLSQWRGYASDATGISIGFSTEYLKWLAGGSLQTDRPGFTLEKVKYDLPGHEAEVEPTYKAVKKLVDQGVLGFPMSRLIIDNRTEDEIQEEKKNYDRLFSNLSMTLLMMFPKLYLLKSPAFKEEREWRLLSYLFNQDSSTCSYRASSDRLIPYRSYDFKELDRQPIRKIILGPKHITPVRVIADYLKRKGYGVVEVVKSEASYR